MASTPPIDQFCDAGRTASAPVGLGLPASGAADNGPRFPAAPADGDVR